MSTDMPDKRARGLEALRLVQQVKHQAPVHFSARFPDCAQGKQRPQALRVSEHHKGRFVPKTRAPQSSKARHAPVLIKVGRCCWSLPGREDPHSLDTFLFVCLRLNQPCRLFLSLSRLLPTPYLWLARRSEVVSTCYHCGSGHKGPLQQQKNQQH